MEDPYDPGRQIQARELEMVNFAEIDSPLLSYARNITSQAGEDGIVEQIISKISPVRKFCIEFGAWDGKLYSNCYNLTKNERWSGLMIEANSKKFEELKGLCQTKVGGPIRP